MHSHSSSPGVSRRRFLSGGLAAAATGFVLTHDRLGAVVSDRRPGAQGHRPSILTTTPWGGGVVGLVSTTVGVALRRIETSRDGDVRLGDVLVTSLPVTFDAHALGTDGDILEVGGAADVVVDQASVCADHEAADSGELDAWGLTALDELRDVHRWAASVGRIDPGLRAEVVAIHGLSTGDHSWLVDLGEHGTALLGTGGPRTREAPYADTVHLIERLPNGTAGNQSLLADQLGEVGTGAMAASRSRRQVSFVSGRNGSTGVFRGTEHIDDLPGLVSGNPVELQDGSTLVATMSADETGPTQLWAVDGDAVVTLPRRRRDRIDPTLRDLVGHGRRGQLIVRRSDGDYAARPAA
jgi:hypothetical protein